jgi:hypothetical protein
MPASKRSASGLCSGTARRQPCRSQARTFEIDQRQKPQSASYKRMARSTSPAYVAILRPSERDGPHPGGEPIDDPGRIDQDDRCRGDPRRVVQVHCRRDPKVQRSRAQDERPGHLGRQRTMGNESSNASTPTARACASHGRSATSTPRVFGTDWASLEAQSAKRRLSLTSHAAPEKRTFASP